ncbi:hypothetical protein DXG01_012210 [Tephrocybe rancida]|nr:hypothetical protein DXG01_012210 [Tephrocybe rancida]
MDPTIGRAAGAGGNDMFGSMTSIMGLSFIASLATNPYIWDSARLLVFGTLIETGRRICQWLMERFKIQYCITAQFTEGDPSYEWIVLFLTQENVWRRSREFRVNEKNSKRKWGLKLGPEVDGNADYVPTYTMPQIFRWNGYWIEIKRNATRQAVPDHHQGGYAPSTIYITMYTLDMNALYKFVEETRVRYKDVSRPNVTVHMADMWPQPTYGPGFVWSNVKHKARRPLSSIILNEGVIESLIKDAQEFIASEEWYVEAGIPHRRGYLLYGPPGTGKSDFNHLCSRKNVPLLVRLYLHANLRHKAGELGLEIYALSLSSGFVDDAFLQKASASIPKNSILLIEDIDCAFPSREDSEDDEQPPRPGQPFGFVSYGPNQGRKSAVTLSGLLNVIDGVGSEEGKLFFATTNYIDRLDPALLRPGRIDMRIQYKQSTQEQAHALFTRFFAPRPKFDAAAAAASSTSSEKPKSPTPESIANLATQFASHIPEHVFSTAELQGFLLSCKRDSSRAVNTVSEWVKKELGERREKEAREEARKAKAKAKRDERERRDVDTTIAKLGGIVGGMVNGGGMVVPPSTPGAGIERVATPVSPSPAYEAPKAAEPSVLPLEANEGGAGAGAGQDTTAATIAVSA